MSKLPKASEMVKNGNGIIVAKRETKESIAVFRWLKMQSWQQTNTNYNPNRNSIGRILCPINLSKDSDEATRYAVALSTVFQAKLYILHSIENSSATWDKEIKSLFHIKKLFEETLKPYIDPNEKLDWEGKVVEGDATEAIIGEASNLHVNLIVMRSRRRPYSAAILGSVAEAVSRLAPCPVLVTHPKEREWLDSGGSKLVLKNLLVGYDFSEYADLALSYALLFAKDYGANVYILHVVPRIAEATSAYPTTYNHAYKKLQTILPADTKSTYKTEFLVSEGPPYREILIQAEEKNIDMVFMGTRGADFGMKAIFGSNVDRVIRLSPCPVFIARPLKWN